MKNDYLIHQKPLPALMLFSLPMILGNLFQQTYTMIDSAILGRFVSQEALGAVGASYALTNIFIFIAIGGGIGASVVVSQYFGAENYKAMKTSISTTMLSFLTLSIIFSITGFLFGRSFMEMLQTPDSILDLAMEYLYIYFLGLPLLFMYNVISALFNALGKSKITLFFLMFSSVLNVVLDYYMVTALHMGISGVAWATLIAQGVAAILSFIVFIKELKKFEDKCSHFFEKKEMATMARIAVPSILQQSTVGLGMLLVQSVINSFGDQVLAGFSAAMRIETLCIVPMVAIGNALSSYTAQNMGARQPERVIQGYHAANGMVIVFSIIIFLALTGFPHAIITFFLGDNGTPTAMSAGQDYIAFMGWFFCLIGFKMTADGLLRGAGDMKMFTIANLINLAIRVILSITLAPKFGFAVIWYAIPAGWLVNVFLSYYQYRTGKWKWVFQVSKS